MVDTVQGVCQRDVEDTIVTGDEFGACGGFDNDCDETGIQSRNVTRCRSGFELPGQDSRECQRETDEKVLEQGEFGECANFATDCAKDGTKSRNTRVCENGRAVDGTEDVACVRETMTRSWPTEPLENVATQANAPKPVPRPHQSCLQRRSGGGPR